MQLRILFLPNILREYVHASVECGQSIQQKWNSFYNQDGILFLLIYYKNMFMLVWNVVKVNNRSGIHFSSH